MIYYAQGALIVLTFLLASKDADAYMLFSFSDTVKVQKKLKAWHLKGALIYSILLVIGFYCEGWKIVIAGLLIRLSFYDITFNSGAGLDKRHIGTTAFWDKQFSKIFGVNGAVKKAVIFFLILVALNVINESL